MPLSSLLRRSLLNNLRSLPLRSFSSGGGTPISFTLSVEPEPEPDSEPETPSPNDDLRSRIFRLRFPKRSATSALDKWVGEGNTVAQSELRQIAKDLNRSKRYKHALEIMTWMESQGNFQMRAPDHATKLELITKVHSLSEAEAYFDRLSTSSSQKAAAFPLLHSYVKDRNLKKAEALMQRLEALMQRLLNSGLAVSPHLFNEMMKLYVATGQFDEVLSVIRHMKLSKIPLTGLSYSLWLNASGEISGVSSVEMVYKDMINDENVKVAERMLSVSNRLAYSFIMTCYAALKDGAGVLRVWESSKRVPTRITCANYMSVMLSLIKIGDLKAAEGIFREWELQCHNYDVRVSNVLLGAYMRNRWMDKAEAFHLYTLERGAVPNYKTWEILMEGWVNNGQMDKAVEAMRKGFSKLKGCIWKPPEKIILAIAEYFEEQCNIGEMRRYIKVLEDLGLMSLPLYKLALRTHINLEAKALDIIEMMERDKIELDEEVRALIQQANQPRNSDMFKKLISCPTPLKSFFTHYW
ncbi:pentatricopeptide repeat-containing protein At5g27460-like isoform X2 [Asparagus officinalis]|uniref:pentatricopeptide repeat-containing protein At5g27460-like isoform X2 n=1 Tax=Asparagus officinalis TaxID=4686 RepID=UPI00098DEA07|nr:pentatricopeptide repeat-containing protein At5g27460-like isoform X2 [Asparagus officinalis]